MSFDSPSRLPLGTGGPRPNALRNSSEMSASSESKAPPVPRRPHAQRSNGGLMYGGSRYGKESFFFCLYMCNLVSLTV